MIIQTPPHNLLRQAWAFGAEHLGGQPSEQAWLNQKASLDRTLSAIALDSDEIVGAIFSREHPVVAIDGSVDERVVIQTGMVVEPSHRGQGLSTSLMAHVEQTYRLHGVSCVLSWPKHPAHDVRHGFLRCTTYLSVCSGDALPSIGGSPDRAIASEFVPGDGSTVANQHLLVQAGVYMVASTVASERSRFGNYSMNPRKTSLHFQSADGTADAVASSYDDTNWIVESLRGVDSARRVRLLSQLCDDLRVLRVQHISREDARNYASALPQMPKLNAVTTSDLYVKNLGRHNWDIDLKHQVVDYG